jgi:hypothetical protein
MMHRTGAGLLALALGLHAGAGLCSETTRGRTIPEAAVRAASAKQYSDLLRRACANGWRFTRGDVLHGFERHYDELSLALADAGYTIIAKAAVPVLVVREIAVDALTGRGGPHGIGCFRAYWNTD